MIAKDNVDETNNTQMPPKLRLSGWRRARLGNYCLHTSIVNPTANPDEPFLYVDVSSVSNETYSIDEPRQLLGGEAPSRARKGIRAGDVLFATVRPALRRIAIVPGYLDGQVASTGYCVVRANQEELDPNFVYFYLLTEEVRARVESLQKGVTYPAINDSDVLDLLMPLPPLPEQRAIARVLRAIQDAIAARQRELELERERKAALMQHLFTHGTRGEPTKMTEIGEMPESWRVVQLGDICRFHAGTQPPRSTFLFAPSPGYVRLLQIRDFETDEYATYVSTLYNLRVVAEHDILVARYGASVGKVLTGKAGAINVAIMKVMPDTARMSRQFLYYFLQLSRVQRFIKGLGGRSAQAGFNQGELNRLEVPLPTLEEQDELALALRTSDNRIKAVDKEAKSLEELFRALLEELMAGRLSALLLVEGVESLEVIG